MSGPDFARPYTAYTLWVDLNGDGENNLLVINQRAAMKILVRQARTKTSAPVELLTETQDAPAGAVVFDHDNDGDGEILYSSAFHTLDLVADQGGRQNRHRSPNDLRRGLAVVWVYVPWRLCPNLLNIV